MLLLNFGGTCQTKLHGWVHFYLLYHTKKLCTSGTNGTALFCLQCNSGEWWGGAGAATSGSFASRSRDCGCKGVEAPTMFPEPTMDRSVTVEEAAHSCDPSHVRNTHDHKLVWWAGRVTFPQGTSLGAGSHLGLWWSWCRRRRERTLVASFISVMLKHKFAIPGHRGG